jgi:hypothetical protein
MVPPKPTEERTSPSKRIGMGAGDNIADYSRFIGFTFIGLDVGVAKFSKVIQHNVNSSVVRDERWRVAAGEFGFLHLDPYLRVATSCGT